MAHLDFWFDYSCPYAYLGSTQVEALAARAGATLTWRPMLLGGVFRANGTPQNLAGALSPAKAHHNMLDMNRWADAFGVTLKMPDGHPLRSVEALRATLVTGVDPKVVHGLYRAYWVEGRAPSSPDVLRDVLTKAGHDADSVLARISEDSVKEDLRRRTDEAIALGVFGAPAYVVNGKELFWGQDRAEFVERALSGHAADVIPEASMGKSSGKTLELYFDFSSPFAYLAATQAEALAARTGATLIWRPMLLGALFRAIGQADVPLSTFSPAKQAHTMSDMNRWASHWGTALRFPTRFPMNTVKALRAFLALPEAARASFVQRVFRAYWVDDRDINDEATLRELLGEHAALLSQIGTPEIKSALFEATDRAVKAGVFGAPTWVVDGIEIFWGQDRIPFVEQALRASGERR